MKSGLTYLIFVIDRSGSMEKIRNDMIGGFNSLIKTQQAANLGDCRVFACKFDTTYDVMFENLDLNNVPSLTTETYVPRGGTALYDSLGKTINDIGVRLATMKEEDRPEKILVVTITDGEDNDHLRNEGVLRLDSEQVRQMVEHQTKNYNWSFAYIGANQDAWAVGSSMGYSKGTTLNYTADSVGTAYAFKSLCDSTSKYRSAAGSTKFAFSPDPVDVDDANVQISVSVNSKNTSKKTV